MINAFKEGKDIYAIFSQAAFNNEYQDNLEYYREFEELVLDSKKIIAGNGKESLVEVEDDYIVVPRCYSLETPQGYVRAEDLKVGDVLKGDDSCLTIVSFENIPNPINHKDLKINLKKVS